MTRIEVLDHGYLSLVETWGSDERIVEAARMSTGKGFLGWGPACEKCGEGRPPCNVAAHNTVGCPVHGEVPGVPGDEKLLRYLYENHHDTPFEMAGMIVEAKAPIVVFRQWHRHRAAAYNEMSARYTSLPDEDYVPTVARLMQDGGKNKQARGASDVALTEGSAQLWLMDLRTLNDHAERVYQRGLAIGVPKELARLATTTARYSRHRASMNLRMWLHFLSLRKDPHAQWEIRVYADAIGTLIEKAFPRTWQLFKEGRPKT